MCYQLPGEITRDGKPIVGGVDINATDREFAARVYPRLQSEVTAKGANEYSIPDWGQERDVSDVELKEYEFAI